MLNRRSFAGSLLSFVPFARLRAAESPTGPWSARQLMQPEQLAALLGDSGKRPVVISVVFPVLYRQKHIKGALFCRANQQAGRHLGIETGRFTTFSRCIYRALLRLLPHRPMSEHPPGL